jgi:Flp pilus assembly protein TadG
VLRTQRRIRNDQTGTAMVELALVLPILAILALGIVDFGRAINYWNDTNQLAADAARFAAVDRNPGEFSTTTIDDDFRDWVRLQADTEELQEGTVAGGAKPSESVTSQLQVCINSPADPPLPLTVGNPIRVQVKSSYNLLSFFDQLPMIEFDDNDFGSINISSEAVMRLEQDYSGATGCKPA